MPYCMAIHRFAKESKIKWFHWTHSNPRPMPSGTEYPHSLRYSLPDNSKIVYLNNNYLINVAESYHTFPKNVRIVYNPRDPRLFYNLHPLVKSILDKYPVLEADLIQVYPVSTPRMIDGKQIKIVIDVLGELKKLGKSVALIVCNAHANDKREQALISEVGSYCASKGLNSSEVIFTSLEGKEYETGVSQDVVSQLFQLSNLFIFPSVSENCSLILLEAMLSKCLLVLNDDVGSMREFGKENALYFKFGNFYSNVNYENRERFMNDVAKIIISEFNSNRALKAAADLRKNYNIDAIFKRQILPLLHEYN